MELLLSVCGGCATGRLVRPDGVELLHLNKPGLPVLAVCLLCLGVRLVGVLPGPKLQDTQEFSGESGGVFSLLSLFIGDSRT